MTTPDPNEIELATLIHRNFTVKPYKKEVEQHLQ